MDRPPVREVSPAEGWELLDRQARRYHGLSAGRFVRRWTAGELDPDAPHVLRVAMLIPLAGPEPRPPTDAPAR